MTSAALRSHLKKITAEELRGAEVLDLSVEETVDHGGDPILDIAVTVTLRNAKAASGKSLLNLLRRTSDYLISQGDTRFPHFHFIAANEVAA